MGEGGGGREMGGVEGAKSMHHVLTMLIFYSKAILFLKKAMFNIWPAIFTARFVKIHVCCKLLCRRCGKLLRLVYLIRLAVSF